MTFYRVPISILYFLYKKKWSIFLNENNINVISLNKINHYESSMQSPYEFKLWEIYKFNVLYKFYKNNQNLHYENNFINNLIQIINKLSLQLNSREKQVINSLQTSTLLVDRALKDVVVPFTKLSNKEKCYLLIDNVKLYFINCDNNGASKEPSNYYKNFAEEMNSYKLKGFGTLYLTTKRMVIFNRQDNNFNLDLSYSINYSHLKNIKITSEFVYINYQKKLLMLLFPNHSTTLFKKYLHILKNRFKIKLKF